MKKNIVKAMLKVMATTAVAAAMFIGGGKMEAKAYSARMSASEATRIVAERNGVDESEVFLRDDLCAQWEALRYGDDAAEVEADAQAFINGGNLNLNVINGTEDTAQKSQKDLLPLVNADRANYGAGKLTWNKYLELIAQQRAFEIYCNTLTKEFVDAANSGDFEAQCAVVHTGARESMMENANIGFNLNITTELANQSWIASESHHVVRINAGFTQYAAASYKDEYTGEEIWVELFQ